LRSDAEIAAERERLVVEYSRRFEQVMRHERRAPTAKTRKR
jgi:hypothetical protein